MTYKEKIAILNQIEEAFPVHTIIYQGIGVWPLIRSNIVYGKTFPRNQYGLFYFLRSLIDILISLFRTIKRSIHNTAKKDSSRKAAFVYVAKTDERREKINQKYFSKFGDSLKYFAPLKANFKLLEYSNGAPYRTPTFSHTTYIDPLLKLYRSYLLFTKIFNSKRDAKPFLEFEQYLKASHSSISIDFISIIDQLDFILIYAKYFKRKFQQLQAKVVIYSFFPSTISYSVTLACSTLNIKSVDIQHGQQGDYAPMYTHWKNFPKNGYTLLPLYFWMWGHLSNQRMNWMDSSPLHQHFIGGNSWMAFNVENTPYLKEKSVKHNRKNLLVSMQIPKDFKESCIIPAMQKEENIFWYIRLHPAYKHQLKEIKLFLENKKLNNFDLEMANTLSLYQLLPKVDIQVTFWSSVAYEALHFDIPTIIVHPQGLEHMKEYIDNEIFKYTESPEALLAIIDTNSFQKEKIKYININPNLIKETLLNLL